ncbi:MAG: adenylosuccinate lyase [Synergistaceae bacterium]|jgi:adenylosuccinate lyase|nr:adenylosuccinate lyase [Synergistaceae bacterium]
MIERYETAKMKEIWSETNKFRTWLDVELAVCRVWNKRGVIPDEAMKEIAEKADFDVERINEIEAQVHHDVIAFVSSVAERIGAAGRYVHLGLTSSDVLDTASALLLSRSLDVIIEETEGLAQDMLQQAWRHKDALCVGRTHGIHGEPTTFGLKLLNHYDQLTHDLRRLRSAREGIAYGKISGAVGTYAHTGLAFEEEVCALLDLKVAPVATQILQRDRHGEVMTALALLGTALERFSLEIRHLQRTEVREAFEPFGKGQKGSSAMPHKRNPILCERICGMARLLRSYGQVALENVALWHERDISHSSVERVIWPDAFHLAHYGLRITRKITSGLEVDRERMKKNLAMTQGLVFSQRVLLELVERFDLGREEAYAIVQDNAMACWEGKGHFRELLQRDERLRNRLSTLQLEALFDVEHYTQYIDEIFARFSKP